MSKLTKFVDDKLSALGWSYNELARRACLSSSGVSHVMSGTRNPGFEFCVTIARALGEQPEKILRLAELLPPIPPPIATERECTSLFRRLNERDQNVIINTMRSLLDLPITMLPQDTIPARGAPSKGGETEMGPFLGDAILRMDNPLRICYEVLVDVLTTEQMYEFISRLVQKVDEVGAPYDRIRQDDLQRPAPDTRDDGSVPIISEGAGVSEEAAD